MNKKKNLSKFIINKLPFITWKEMKTNTNLTIGKTEVHQEEYSVFNIVNFERHT